MHYKGVATRGFGNIEAEVGKNQDIELENVKVHSLNLRVKEQLGLKQTSDLNKQSDLERA